MFTQGLYHTENGQNVTFSLTSSVPVSVWEAVCLMTADGYGVLEKRTAYSVTLWECHFFTIMSMYSIVISVHTVQTVYKV